MTTACAAVSTPDRRRLQLRVAYALALAVLAGCATEPGPSVPPPRPEDIRAQIASLMPAATRDRAGWAVDIYAAMSAQRIEPSPSNICAVLAIVAQESSFQADPPVPNLGKIAWEEIDRRAERAGLPKFAVHAALQLTSGNSKSYADRIDAAKTERELSETFEDFIGMIPMGPKLFADKNPVRTGGPMQVGIAFAEKYQQAHPYPYPMTGSLRHEVFTRRGGLYFGIAHLLDYPAQYDKPLYRFADYNAGRYASRNAAFQSAMSAASGIPLALDGDLLVPGATAIGATETAARALGRQINLSDAEIRRALELEGSPDLDRSALYQRVFELAERIERRALPRAKVPNIRLDSPKITRKLTTEWFATRVDERHRQCLARANAPTGARSQ